MDEILVVLKVILCSLHSTSEPDQVVKRDESECEENPLDSFRIPAVEFHEARYVMSDVRYLDGHFIRLATLPGSSLMITNGIVERIDVCLDVFITKATAMSFVSLDS